MAKIFVPDIPAYRPMCEVTEFTKEQFIFDVMKIENLYIIVIAEFNDVEPYELHKKSSTRQLVAQLQFFILEDNGKFRLYDNKKKFIANIYNLSETGDPLDLKKHFPFHIRLQLPFTVFRLEKGLLGFVVQEAEHYKLLTIGGKNENDKNKSILSRVCKKQTN